MQKTRQACPLKWLNSQKSCPVWLQVLVLLFVDRQMIYSHWHQAKEKCSLVQPAVQHHDCKREQQVDHDCQQRLSQRERENQETCLKCLVLALCCPNFLNVTIWVIGQRINQLAGNLSTSNFSGLRCWLRGEMIPSLLAPLPPLLCRLPCCPLTAIYLLPNDSLCHGKLSSLQISPEKGSLSVCPSDKAKRGRSVWPDPSCRASQLF